MRFFYVHFPKAGGTSLRMQLEEQFPGRTLADYAHDPIGGADVHVEAQLPDEIEGVFGHLHPLRYCNWSEAMFTVLREPVQNIISIYHFWLSFPSTGSPIHDRFLAEKPGIVDFARDYPLRRLMSEAYFGGFDMNRFDFVGFHEQRIESFAAISRLLGVHIRPDFYANKTDAQHDDARRSIDQDPRLIGALRDVLSDDMRFYEAMRFRWG